MPSGQNSFIDIAALDPIRTRFGAGEALAVLSTALDCVIWANGAGATLFGYSDVRAITGAEPQIGLAAKRQIMATSGYPRIGKERAITVRLASGLMSRAVPFAASELTLPGGEAAILLAHAGAAASWRGAADLAERAIAGLDMDGRHVAIVDADGRPLAASHGFAALEISPESLVTQADHQASGERLTRGTVKTSRGEYAAALLRLTDEAAFVEVSDEPLSQSAPVTETAAAVAAKLDAGDDAPATEQPGDQPARTEPQGEPAAEQVVTAEGPTVEAPAIPSETPPIVAGAEPIEDEHQPTAAAHDERAERSPAAEQHQDLAVQASEPAAAGEAEHEPAQEALASQVEADAPAPRDAAGASDTETVDAEPAAAEEQVAEAAALPHVEIDRSAAAVTFVWKTDAAGRFSEIGEDFVRTVGKPAGDVIGLSFREAAARLGIDPMDEIAGLLERRDTWSGRAVLWPVAGTDLRIPVDLAALPTYDRDRKFGGFRGFGVARVADAVVDPEATGLALLAGTTPAAHEPATPVQEADPATAETETPADPFQGEPPILTIVPKPERRQADKVIRLAEHRQPTIDKSLSPGERIAFREIGDRLKKESGVATAKNSGDKNPGDKGVGDKRASEAGRRADNDARSAPARDDAGREGEEPRPAGLSEAEEAPSAAAGETAPHDDARAGDEASQQAAPVGLQGAAGEAGAEQLPEAELPAADDEPVARHENDPTEEPSAESVLEEAPPASTEPVEEAEAAIVEPTAAPAEAVTASNDQPTPEPRAADAAAVHEHIPSAFAVGTGKRAAIDTSILDRLPVPVLIHAGDTLHYANQEFFELTGYQSIEELRVAGGLDALFGEPYPAGEGQPEAGRSLRLRTGEGLEYPVEAFLQSVPWGEGKSLLLSLRRSWRQPVSYPAAALGEPASEPEPEFEEQSDAEERIEEMRAIVDTATDGVVLIAPDGTIRSISSPAEALFGFDSEEVAGKPFSALFAIESQRAARDYLNGLSENGVASVLNDGREVIGREAQGRFIPLFMTIGKLPNDSGFCAVLRDITQWKRAEEELTQARAQAERTSSQKTDFLARVSHEIRTPLNAIIGFSELMLDEKFGPVGNDRYRDYLRDINRSGNHVLDLVNDLLDISKIEAGQQEMSYEAVSLNDTLAETVAMMQPSANRERVIIRSSFASRLPEVVADLRSVRQIALNLLSNAIRYTPAGGQVIVSTAYEASGDVVMRVRDTGIGMTQAEIEQALKPFKQINALKRGRGDGTGLGLPLTKAMVEANRARFIINSTPGEGTLVEVTFPSTRVLAD